MKVFKILLKVMTALFMVLILFTGCKKESSNPAPGGALEEELHEVTMDETEEEEGGQPWVLNIDEATVANDHYRIEQWTGKYMQMVLMSIKPGEEIDLEVHEGHDQFIRIEQGEARVLMGRTKNDLSFDETVRDDWAIFIPAGYFHNIRNTGDEDLKVYTIYAPKEHKKGTLHRTYEKAREAHYEEH